MVKKLVECSFLVPIVADTDRRPHAPVAWRLLQDAIYDAFKGLSGPERFGLVKDVELVPGSYIEGAWGGESRMRAGDIRWPSLRDRFRTCGQF